MCLFYISTYLSDLELPSCPPPEPEEQTEHVPSMTLSSDQDETTKDTTDAGQVISPPMSLSIVSSLTDSDPPSPATEGPGIPIGDASNNGLASSKGK